ERLDQGDRAGAMALLEPLREKTGTDPRALAVLGALYVEAGRSAEAVAVLKPLADRPDADPGVLYNAGRGALAAGDLENGERYLTRSASLAPLSPAARELGLHYGRLGRDGDALSLLVRWLQADPDDSEARLAAAAAAVRLERAADAKVLLEGLNAQSDPVRVLRAEVAELEGDPARVLVELGNLTETPPAGLEREVLLLAARAYLDTNQPQETVRVLSAAPTGDPHVTLLFGQALLQLSQAPAAVTALKPFADGLLNADPRKDTIPGIAGEMLVAYAQGLDTSGKRDEALAALRKATELQPGYRPGWEAYSALLATAGQAAEAKAAQAKAAALQTSESSFAGGDPVAEHLQSALGNAAKGDTARAVAELREQAGLHPRDPRPQLLLARVLTQAKRYPEGLAAAEAALKIDPKSADALYQRGAVQMAAGRSAEAEADFRKALAANGNHVPALNDLAVLLMTRNSLAEAEQLLHKVLALAPTDELANANLARLREKQKGS
nr:tetratricopeptide repeat protein [Thermoanaerobaculia bacterium]